MLVCVYVCMQAPGSAGNGERKWKVRPGELPDTQVSAAGVVSSDRGDSARVRADVA